MRYGSGRFIQTDLPLPQKTHDWLIQRIGKTVGVWHILNLYVDECGIDDIPATLRGVKLAREIQPVSFEQAAHKAQSLAFATPHTVEFHITYNRDP